MRRIVLLAAIAVASLVAFSAIANAAIVGSRYQAENMTLGSSTSIQDETNASDDGTHIRWSGVAGPGNEASMDVNIDDTVDQIQLRVRESGSGLGDDRLAVYVDSTASGDKVGSVLPPAGSTWQTLTVNLTEPIPTGAHTIYIGPDQTNDAFVALDWFELHHVSTDDVTPPTVSITSAAKGTTSDSTPTFTFTGSDNVAVDHYGCRLFLSTDTGGSFQDCTSPFTPSQALTDGEYKFQVRAYDAAGNYEQAGETFTVDAVANGDALPKTVQAEDMTFSSANITSQPDPDGTGPAGPNLRWETGSGTADKASVTVNLGDASDKVTFQSRQVAGRTFAFNFYVDNVLKQTAALPVGNVWEERTVTLDVPAGSHTIAVAPSATTDGRMNLDYMVLDKSNDRDGDGVLDTDDNCPNAANSGQADSDSDGTGDACDSTPQGPDADSDGVPDTLDNCPNDANPDQANHDGGNNGDACDPDDDNDGRPDGTDYDPWDPNIQDPPSGSNLPLKVEAEAMAHESLDIESRPDPDGTGPAGPNLRWKPDANDSDNANIDVNLNAAASTIEVFGRQASGTHTFNIYVDGGQAAQVALPTGNTWASRTVAINVPTGQHEIAFAPSGPTTDYTNIDWFTLKSVGSPPADSDGDGVNDTSDNCVSVPNSGQADNDGDGTGNACDPTPNGPDSDGDGVPDSTDQCDLKQGPASNNGCPVAEAAHIVGAGDIADVGDADQATANLIKASGRTDATVLTLGDNAYNDGSSSDYSSKYTPTWGDFKNRTKPTPGNHDYHTAGAGGYKSYFGDRATPVGNQTYYAYDAGAWRIYALDTEIDSSAGSPQYNWIKNDLENNAPTSDCIMAYGHTPIASSGEHGIGPDAKRVRPLFAMIANNGGDLYIAGHDHDYERFPRVDANGTADANGMVQMVVGTGGTAERSFTSNALPATIKRNANTHGIFDINLTSNGWNGDFVPANYAGNGNFTDSFSGSCGDPRTGPVPEPEPSTTTQKNVAEDTWITSLQNNPHGEENNLRTCDDCNNTNDNEIYMQFNTDIPNTATDVKLALEATDAASGWPRLSYNPTAQIDEVTLGWAGRPADSGQTMLANSNSTPIKTGQVIRYDVDTLINGDNDGKIVLHLEQDVPNDEAWFASKESTGMTPRLEIDGGGDPTPGDPDTDGDGVADSVDQCDGKPGPASNNGCPLAAPSGDGFPGLRHYPVMGTYAGADQGWVSEPNLIDQQFNKYVGAANEDKYLDLDPGDGERYWFCGGRKITWKDMLVDETLAPSGRTQAQNPNWSNYVWNHDGKDAGTAVDDYIGEQLDPANSQSIAKNKAKLCIFVATTATSVQNPVPQWVRADPDGLDWRDGDGKDHLRFDRQEAVNHAADFLIALTKKYGDNPDVASITHGEYYTNADAPGGEPSGLNYDDFRTGAEDLWRQWDAGAPNDSNGERVNIVQSQPILTGTNLATIGDVRDIGIGISGSGSSMFESSDALQDAQLTLYGKVPLQHQVNTGPIGQNITWPKISNPFGFGQGPHKQTYSHIAWYHSDQGVVPLDSLMMRDDDAYVKQWHDAYQMFGPNGTKAIRWGQIPNVPK